MMKLSPRLKKIVDFTDKCGVVADIGTDHALVPVYLIENGLYKKAYACDIRPLPLKRAEKYIFSRNLSDKITTIQTNGLQNVPDDTDTVVIAGMGGEMIIDILSSDISHHSATFVLQAMTAVDSLREFLYKNGYQILDEDIVAEQQGRKLYSVIKTQKTDLPKDYSAIDVLLSPALQRKKSAEKEMYIKKLIFTRSKILENINKSKIHDENYINMITDEMNLLKECL
ncbi:MAG: SAM-dependent methyltransferase [Clostridia bacterium]|nr:SAM-dependent methyltransferase [Clostridia bacterium]